MIDPELRKKAEKAVIAKEKKKNKELKMSPIEVERDSFDEALDESNKSLSEKLGMSPTTKKLVNKSKKAANKSDGMKQTKLNFGAASKKTTSAAKSEDDSEMDEFDLALEQAVPLR